MRQIPSWPTGSEAAMLLSVFDLLGAETGVVDAGSTAWMLSSSAMVLVMVPGLALFYGGMVRPRSVLTTMMHSFVAMAIIGVQWVLVGYCLAFGRDVYNGLIGFDPAYLGLAGISHTQLYADKGVADVLAHNEPFLQTRRVALENLLQGYQDKLDKLALKAAAAAPGTPPATPPVEAPARAP
jgi:hypothetical protein